MIVYTNHPETGTIIGIVYGEMGYYHVTTDCSAELLNQLNTGASREVADSFLAGSMFSWDIPAANAARQFYLEHNRRLS